MRKVLEPPRPQERQVVYCSVHRRDAEDAEISAVVRRAANNAPAHKHAVGAALWGGPLCSVHSLGKRTPTHPCHPERSEGSRSSRRKPKSVILNEVKNHCEYVLGMGFSLACSPGTHCRRRALVSDSSPAAQNDKGEWVLSPNVPGAQRVRPHRAAPTA